MKLVLTSLALLVILLSCEKDKTSAPDRKPLALTETEKQKVEADNAFTFNLFKAVLGNEPENKNVFTSPLSASIALGMTTNGSSGETLKAMRSTLQLSDMPESEVNAYYKKLSGELPQLDSETTLEIANSIWYRKGLVVLPTFTKTNADYYFATIQALDFSNPSAPEVINTWVKNKTQDKIPSIIEGPIADNTMMYLINAIYFKGQWKYPFDKNKTKKDVFHVSKDQVQQVDFMTADAVVRTGETALANTLEIPYGNGTFSMVIVQPKGALDLQGLTADLTASMWQQALTEAQQTKAFVVLPKFKFEYEKELKPELSSLGMGIAFSDDADFSHLSADQRLQLTNVKQKTFVEVNEEGTEAAAVTSIGVGVTSFQPKPTITINRPFLFAVKENSSGLILFMGRVVNPI